MDPQCVDQQQRGELQSRPEDQDAVAYDETRDRPRRFVGSTETYFHFVLLDLIVIMSVTKSVSIE